MLVELRSGAGPPKPPRRAIRVRMKLRKLSRWGWGCEGLASCTGTISTCHSFHVLLPTLSQSSAESFKNKPAGSTHGGSASRFCITANGVMRTRLRRLARTKPFRKPRPQPVSGHIASQPPLALCCQKKSIRVFMRIRPFSVMRILNQP